MADINEYVLSPEEREAFNAINMRVLISRSKVLEAKRALEEAEQEARDCELAAQGALSLLGTVHKLDGAQLTPDLKKLVRNSQ